MSTALWIGAAFVAGAVLVAALAALVAIGAIVWLAFEFVRAAYGR